MARKPKKTASPQVNEELKGFEININEFGEISSTLSIAKLNDFLDDNVEDKKFRGVKVVKRDEDSMTVAERETADKKND